MTDTTQNDDIRGEWKGVTLDELRFMRAASLIRLEMQREYLRKKIGETLPINAQNTGALVNGISGKLSFVQKTLLFIKGVRLTSSLISFFKRSKKK